MIDLKGKRFKNQKHPLWPYKRETNCGNALVGFRYADGGKALSPKFLTAGNFNNGLARVKTDEGWGYISTNLVFTIPAQYFNAGDFSDGLAPVCDSTGLWGFIDTNGTFSIKPTFLSARQFSEGLAAVQADNKKWGYIGTNGLYEIRPSFARAGNFINSVSIVDIYDPKKERLVDYYINYEGTMLIRIQDDESCEIERLRNELSVIDNGEMGQD